jgi:hygromycin-B 7''-O-kinase
MNTGQVSTTQMNGRQNRVPPINLADWSRIFTDAAYWRPLIEEVWRRHGLGHPREISPGFPGSNAVFVVDRALVVKIAWPFERAGFYRELELLRLLAPYRATLLTPEVMCSGVVAGEPDWPYFVMGFLPGERLGEVWAQVPRGDQIAIAEHLGHIVRALHEVPLEGITTLETSPAAWIRFVEEQAAACAGRYRREGGLPSHLIEQLPAYLAGAQPLFPADFSPVLLNGDVTEDHELLSLVDGHWRVSGCIDFGDALVGHNEYEFTCVHLWTFGGDAELTRAFLRAYGWDGWDAARFSRRMMACCLLHPDFRFDSWIAQFGGPEHVGSLEELEDRLWGI